LKIRHTVVVLFVVLAIAFMQPLMTFLGGLTLLLGAGTLIFRDLSADSQDAVEQRVLGWLRRARGAPPARIDPPAVSRQIMVATAEPATPAERIRRGRGKPPTSLQD
jgi:hypothetical protein